MPEQIMIPALPCASITETLDFYVAMGFEITYQQQRPNLYACVKYEDIDLHFFAMKGYEAVNSYSTCLVLIRDADALHAIFKTNLKQALGKVPIAGIPRITRPNHNNAAGDRRFNVVDPGGNWIRFIQQDSPQQEIETTDKVSTKLSRAVKAATLLVDAKGDFSGAATMLDAALQDNLREQDTMLHMRALILRAEVALNLDDPMLTRKLLHQINQIDLHPDEKRLLSDVELQRIDELRQMLNAE